MPELVVNQAAGLMGLGVPLGSQLIPVVSHGDENAELPLLWRLCGALVNLGYLVTVLDATQQEDDENPGLGHMLEYCTGRRGSDPDAPQWNVVPAAKGIQNLCENQKNKAASLQKISQLFPANSVIVLFANANTLTTLLGNSRAQPLLAVSTAKRSLLSSYLALKRLLIGGNLEPLILHMIGNNAHSLHRSADAMAQLEACAKNFLGYDVNAMSIHYSTSEESISEEVRPIAMCLLDRAVPLWSDVSLPLIHEALTTQSTRSH